MSNDAKFGLVIGVVLVILIAVLFFRRDLATAKSVPETTSVAAKPTAVPAPPIAHQGNRMAAQKHVVADGDTLFSLAQRYYGDQSRFIDIYQANRDVLANPGQLR